MGIRSFIKNEGGNFGIIFGLSLLPILGAMGAAFDYSALSQRETALQSAADRAVLAAAHDASNVSEFHNLARKYVESSIPGGEHLQITPKIYPHKVTLRIKDTYQTVTLAAVGKPEIEIDVIAAAAVRNINNGTVKNDNQPTASQIEAERRRLLAQIGNFPPRKHEKLRKKINRQFDRLLRKSETSNGQLRLIK